MNPDLQKIIDAARAGGEVLKKYFGATLELSQKTIVADFRTKADLESEAAILANLTADFPEFNIVSEEKGSIDKNSEYTFYIDPLDGTNNFVLTIANFSISIGLFKDNEIIMGVIYNPIIDNVYYAEKGHGAFVDGAPLQVNSEADLKNSTVCYSRGYSTPHRIETEVMNQLYDKGTKRVMSNWSVAFDFCMLVSGRVEAIISSGLELHDCAAGKLIAREAGAKITNFDGSEEKTDKNLTFVASNGTVIHEEIINILKN